MSTFAPTAQKEMFKNEKAAYFGNFPTLGKINSAYGNSTATQWILVQLWDLAEYAGCKEKLTDNQMRECANIIASKFYYLKVSELMIFFSDFKTGKYGQFYGAVDPIKINASLYEFCKKRGNVIFRHENKVRAIQRENERKDAISYQEWIRIKNQNEKIKSK